MSQAERSEGAEPSDATSSEEEDGARSVALSATPQAAARAERPAPPTVDPYLGTTVDGRYLVEKVLGEGGMGVVYRCRHTIIDKLVAMKVLRSDLARNEEVTGRFLNEARSASSIGNPHIIDISDFGRLPDGATYFIMEYLDGMPLSVVLDEHRALPQERLLKIAVQLAEGLAAAHDSGIIHRDLKPDNVFLLRRGTQTDFVKILDFGIAKATSTNSKLTQAGQVFGTPHYMSPEQAAGSPVDHRSDIYALGVMLYEMACGQLPFDAENFMAILTQHMYRAPSPFATLRELPQPVSLDLEAVILKCLAKDPAERYQSMAELGNDLHALRTGRRPDASRRAPRAMGAEVPAFLDRRRAGAPRPLTRKLLGGLLLPSAALGVTSWWWFANGRAVEAPAALPAPSAPSPADAPQQVSSPGSSVAAPRAVLLAASPLDAHVFRAGRDLGTSPLELEVGAEPIELEVRRDGYRTERVLLDGSQLKVSVGLEPMPSAAPRAASSPPRASTPSAGAPPPPAPPSRPGMIENPWE